MLKLFLLVLVLVLIWLGIIPVKYWLIKAKIWMQEKKFRLMVNAATLFDLFLDIIF